MSPPVCTKEHSLAIPATIFCRYCKRYMCFDCASRHATVTNHDTAVIPVDKLHEPQCMVHRKLKDRFCERCNQFLCDDCIYEDKHNGHSVKAASDIAKEIQRRADVIKEKSRIKMTELRSQVSKINDAMSKITHHTGELDCLNHPNNLTGNDVTALKGHCKVLEKLINDETCRESPSDGRNVKPSIAGENDKTKRKRLKDQQPSEKEGEKKKIKREQNKARYDIQQQDAQLLDNRSMPGTSENAVLQKKLTASGDVNTSTTASGSSPGSSMTTKATQQLNAHSLTNRSVPGTSKNTPLQMKPKASGFNTSATASGSSSMPMILSSLRRTLDLPARIEGMDCVTEDTVVICFGGPRTGICQRQLCARYFSISGEQREFVHENITKASDIAHLEDGRLVAAHKKAVIKVYRADGSQSSRFRSRTMKGFCQVCCDQKNNIYIVNESPKISKFHPDGKEVQREILTGKVKPHQICVTADGSYLVITTRLSNPTLVTIFDKDGNRGDTIKDHSCIKSMYAAIDAHDRVLVASAYVQSNVRKLSLSRYSLHGGKFANKEKFDDITLSPKLTDLKTLPWCYLVSLSPTMLAFAYEQELHFIELH